jgi:ATP-binding protein involved in chromosome partitioning
MAVSELQVQTALKELVDPNTHKDYVSTKSARNIKLEGESVSVDILLSYPAQSQLATIKQQVEDKLKAIDGVSSATANVSFKIVSHSVQRGVKLIPNVKNIIAVETPMVWRGPMVTQALEQLLNNTNWSELDYLVVDLPPGTGDIQLTLAQRVPVTGAVIVTTPQDIALIDARKGLKMFEKVGIPIIGVVENMSLHICSNCGHEERIFGEGGGERMCKDYNVEFLGALPLDGAIRADTDSGRPSVVSDPDGRVTDIYKMIARRVAVKIGETAEDHSTKFPNIVISNT